MARRALFFSACLFRRETCTAWKPRKQPRTRGHEYEEVLRKYLELTDRGFPSIPFYSPGYGPMATPLPIFPARGVDPPNIAHG